MTTKFMSNRPCDGDGRFVINRIRITGGWSRWVSFTDIESASKHFELLCTLPNTAMVFLGDAEERKEIKKWQGGS